MWLVHAVLASVWLAVAATLPVRREALKLKVDAILVALVAILRWALPGNMANGDSRKEKEAAVERAVLRKVSAVLVCVSAPLVRGIVAFSLMAAE